MIGFIFFKIVQTARTTDKILRETKIWWRFFTITIDICLRPKLVEIMPVVIFFLVIFGVGSFYSTVFKFSANFRQLDTRAGCRTGPCLPAVHAGKLWIGPDRENCCNLPARVCKALCWEARLLKRIWAIQISLSAQLWILATTDTHDRHPANIDGMP